MKRILLVGCGQIGSRHLQGLAGLGHDLEIDVVEPRNEASATGRQRFEEAKARNPDKVMRCSWHSDIKDLPAAGFDLAIIATDASARCEIVVALAKQGLRQFLLEKPVCQSEREYDRILEACRSASCKGWVNTIRRYSPVYINCAFTMRNPPFKLEVYGRRFGLGSNAVHYLDLFSMVTGRDDVSITDAQLSPELFPSKRGEGFIEIEGKISGKDGAGNQFSISSLESEPADVRVQLTGSGRTVMVNETLRYIMINKGNTDSEEAFEEPMVSRCTTAICAHILERGSCQLPSLESSRNIHNELFRVFRSHVEKMRGSCPEKIPIT